MKLAIVIALSLASTAAAATLHRGIVPLHDMTSARAAHSATRLASGKVLIAGGCSLPGCDDPEGQLATAELYDPAAGTFTRTADLPMPLISQQAVARPDGSALLFGGYSGTKVSSAVLAYSSGRFRVAGHLRGPRADGAVVELRGGRILVAGGFGRAGILRTAEIYDPRTNRSVPTGSLRIARAVLTATRLRDGRVLVAGGKTNGERVLASAEIFDPKTGRFTLAAPMRVPRFKHGAAMLRDGRVLIVGGAWAFDLGARYRETEIFDPRTKRFAAGPTMAAARYHIPDAVIALPGGGVLVAGDNAQAEIYDPTSKKFRVAGQLGADLSFSTTTLLRDGSVLIAGGYTSVHENPSARAWNYRPSE